MKSVGLQRLAGRSGIYSSVNSFSFVICNMSGTEDWVGSGVIICVGLQGQRNRLSVLGGVGGAAVCSVYLS